MLENIKRMNTLKKFLEFDNAKSDEIFDLFKTVLPNSIYREAPETDEDSLYQKFLYYEGARENKVVLVAHTDTVFENDFRILNQKKNITINQKRCFVGDSQIYGIGADDRVGCAILYLLRESGHSLLLVDGEEFGCIGSKWIVNEHKDILDRLNSHQFMIEFDLRGNNHFKTYDVGSDEFDRFIEKQTGYVKTDNFSNTDICYLCKEICGVNFSVGYYYPHTSRELVVIDDYLQTLEMVEKLLAIEKLPRFEIPKKIGVK